MKVLKLQFNILVEKHIEVGWRDKPLHIKSNYNSTVKEIRFDVFHPFTITKTFREALTGNYCDNRVPLNKKMILGFSVKANDNFEIA